MIITRTPFRISFFGGRTDYPVWYRQNGGAVLSSTINKYCYISTRYLPPFFDHKFRIRYSTREETQNIDQIKHPAVKACLEYLNLGRGVEMVHTSDLPARSGIGSSSAFTVGFLNSLYALKGKIITKRQLARDAIHIEQNLIKESVGSQDQVATSFGGLNKIEFGGDNDFYVYPITISKEKIDFFQSHLLLFFTGLSRTASDIASEQIRKTSGKKAELKAMMEMVAEASDILNGVIGNFNDLGKLLHESWKLKMALTKLIANSAIKDIYKSALDAGALGGKLLGAGGGGFMLFFAPPERHAMIRAKLEGLLHVPFAFENLGTQIVLYSTQDDFSVDSQLSLKNN